MQTGSPPRPYRVQSVARAVFILFEIGESPDGLTPTAVSKALGLHLQTTYHLLHTLTSLGLLTRRGDRYILGVRMAVLAEMFTRQMAPPEFLGPAAREIAERTGETAQAFGWQAGYVAPFTVVPGRFPVQATERPYGSPESAHARATGKLLLAYASPQTRDEYLERNPLRGRTEHTVVDRAGFEDELAQIRERSYAVDNEEFYEGVCCLAVPLAPELRDFGLGLSAPTERFQANFERYLEIMQEVARSLVIPATGEDAEPAEAPRTRTARRPRR